MEKTITKIMCKEHDRIDGLLEEIGRLVDSDRERALEIFNQFKWNLEKHFFVEEKVIFSVYEAATEEESHDTLELLKDHKEILYLVFKIEDRLKEGFKVDVSELIGQLKAHTRFENEVFYPKLDENLNDIQKALIFDRAEEIVEGY